MPPRPITLPRRLSSSARLPFSLFRLAASPDQIPARPKVTEANLGHPATGLPIAHTCHPLVLIGCFSEGLYCNRRCSTDVERPGRSSPTMKGARYIVCSCHTPRIVQRLRLISTKSIFYHHLWPPLATMSCMYMGSPLPKCSTSDRGLKGM